MKGTKYILMCYIDADFKIFTNHIYEYQNGLRNMSAEATNDVKSCLKREKIHYHIQTATQSKINVFFGDKYCVEIIKSFNINSLSKITDEQDFITFHDIQLCFKVLYFTFF